MRLAGRFGANVGLRFQMIHENGNGLILVTTHPLVRPRGDGIDGMTYGRVTREACNVLQT